VREAPWGVDPRIALARARLREREDPDASLRELLAIEASSARIPVLRRVAGFDAVGLLDRLGRYREAFDLATRLYAELTPRADPVEGVAPVVGLPRSGTTLLEQMLDRDPEISGIGEYEGSDRIVGDLLSICAWPRRTASLARDAAQRVQARYVDGARSIARPGARVTFDKTLRAWRYLPAVAAVLPGATCLSVARDPRDAAISTFLSYFHPITDGWTASLASIRRVHESERALVPRALEVLGISHERLVYERFVDAPRVHVERVLARLGLAMDDAVLAPEANRRAVFTLSHGQVRKPINRSSIGRWQNYAFAFDGSWDALAAAHDAARG